MSKLEELIKEFCPNGVIRVTIGKICKISRGIVMSKDFIRDNHGDYPVYSSQTENNGCLGYINTYKYDGEYVTWTTDGANAGTVFYRSGKFSITNVCGLLEVKDLMVVNTKYLYYALSIEARRYVNQGMGNPKLMSNIMASVQIPLPALPVQREIVRVLDSFTLYSAELTAELTARRKQYEFYRDKLLSFDSGNIQRVKLKDICGKVSNIKWQNDDNEYAYIDLSSVDRETHKITIEQRINKENAPSRAQQIVNKGDVLFATTRPTLKRYCKITEEFNGQICSTGFVVLRPKINIILSTYLYYIVSSDRFFTYVEKNQEGTSYPAISDSKVKEFDFSLPPIEVQERIVKVLDNFDAICSDLGIGLPAEIEKRQKQYEYYRDKLLRF